MPWRGKRLPMTVFWPGEFHGLYSVWSHKESDTTERLSLYLLWWGFIKVIFFHFLIGLFVFSLLSLNSSLHILSNSPLSNRSFANILCQSVVCLLILLIQLFSTNQKIEAQKSTCWRHTVGNGKARSLNPALITILCLLGLTWKRRQNTEGKQNKTPITTITILVVKKGNHTLPPLLLSNFLW